MDEPLDLERKGNALVQACRDADVLIEQIMNFDRPLSKSLGDECKKLFLLRARCDVAYSRIRILISQELVRSDDLAFREAAVSAMRIYLEPSSADELMKQISVVAEMLRRDGV